LRAAALTPKGHKEMLDYNGLKSSLLYFNQTLHP
jgi:hypothetical protein